jgi:short-subunit dehydrogenase
MEINGKVAIITGASSGIGLATARLFASQGAKLALVARSSEKLQQLTQELPGSFAITTDMRNENAVRQMLTQAHEHFGKIDILINNAGQGMHMPIMASSPDEYRALFELNIISVFVAMQTVVPLMRKQGGGLIINISSGTTLRALKEVGPYASTKYALNGLSKTARLEFADDNIRVSVVYPGLTNTNFFQNNLGEPTTIETRQSAGIETPEQVAHKILEAAQTEAPEVYADILKQWL